MPLTAKGEEIKTALEKEYGKEKGERVLYAGKNAGTFTGIDAIADGIAAMADGISKITHRFDSFLTRRADATFPTSISHQGKTFEATGKKGRDRSSGEESAEYEAVGKTGGFSGKRIWRTASGKITSD